MALDIPEITELRAVLSAKGNTVLLRGEIDQNNPEWLLEPFFTEVIANMGDEIILDISQLEFINSAAIGCIIEFLIMRKTDSKVKIRVDMSKSWQKYSIDVLTILDEDNISLAE